MRVSQMFQILPDCIIFALNASINKEPLEVDSCTVPICSIVFHILADLCLHNIKLSCYLSEFYGHCPCHSHHSFCYLLGKSVEDLL